jgi:hypothetical protein
VIRFVIELLSLNTLSAPVVCSTGLPLLSKWWSSMEKDRKVGFSGAFGFRAIAVSGYHTLEHRSLLMNS